MTADGQKADEHVADEAPRHRILAKHAFEYGPECTPVEHDDREDRAKLDDDVECRPLLRVEAEQLGGKDQMACRRDRQEFGHPLDDAEDDRNQKDRHP